MGPAQPPLQVGLLLLLLLLLAAGSAEAARVLATAQTQPQGGVSLQQLQAQIQAQLSPAPTTNSTSNSTATSSNAPTPLKPTQQFVTLPAQQRPTAHNSTTPLELQLPAPLSDARPFECGKPLMPCGSAIPEGKSCAANKGGPGWCEKGHFCGYETTNTEPSRCLPLPEDCGRVGQPCCPSNADRPHSGSEEDKLSSKPFCRDGSTCFYFAPVRGLNNGDNYAGNKGAYACTAVAPDCGTGPGKPCCPLVDKMASNPPLNNRTGCGTNSSLYCNYDVAASSAPNSTSKPEHMSASVPGTCEANAADCGKFGATCCVDTSAPSSTGFVCGARWNETGQRGYCADPFDANNRSVGPGAGAMGGARALVNGSTGSLSSSNGSSSLSSNTSSGGGGRKARYSELVCTPCPPRTEAVANNPSLYYPC